MSQKENDCTLSADNITWKTMESKISVYSDKVHNEI